ncbi:MAG TPA: PA14 domain-containing protein, partial [Chloroflexia bacterium]|nr:PA14 domain-containing protein [Chloroflexia bacterium]
VDKTPALPYLAPGIVPRLWPGLQALPLPPGDGRDVTLALEPALVADRAYLARLYPHITFDELRTPTGEGPMMVTIHIPAADLTALAGVQARLSDPGAPAPRETRRLPEFRFDWATAGGKPGTVRLAATVHVDQAAIYHFAWQPAGPPQPDALRVDGFAVPPGGTQTLGIGLHSLVATDTVATAAGVATLRWAAAGQDPQAIPADSLFDPERVVPHGLTGVYRAGASADSPIGLTQVDPVISFFYHRPVLNLPYSVEWTGRLYVPQAGLYTFTTEQISTSQLSVDGAEIIVNPGENQPITAGRDLVAGWHDLRLRYLNAAPQYGHVYLSWTPPGRPTSIIPAAFLWPVLGQYPDPAQPGPWPTLAESDGGTGGSGPGGGAPPPAPAPAAPAGAVLTPRLLLGEGSPALPQPRGAGADAAGNLYIFSGGDSKVHKFSPASQEIASWPVVDASGQPLAEGSALLVQGTQVQVLDAATSDLLAYDLVGKPAGRTHLCDCFSPRGIAPARDGNFWVADTGNNRVLEVRPDGHLVQTLGTKGAGPGQFSEPASVWESPQGVLFVADIQNGRVQSLGPDRQPLAAWPMGASVARDGNRLSGDPAGTVLVTQADGPAVVRYDAHGKELGRWVYQHGGQPRTPSGIAPAGAGAFLVLYLDDGLAALFTPR